MPNWYFVDGEQAAGPIDDAALRELALGGRIRPGSLVTPVGSNRWYTLSEFEQVLALHRNVIGEYGHVPGESTIRFARLRIPPDRSSPGRVAASSRRRAPGPNVRWGRRMLAALVDVVAFATVTIAVGWLIGGFVVVHEPGRDSLRLGSRGLVLAGVLALLYFGVLVGTTGRSLGKILFGIRIVDGEEGGPVGSSRGVMRFLLMVAMLAPCGVPLVIDALWPLRDRLHRTLHDKLLGTLAIRSRHAALSQAPVAHREVRGDVV